MQVALFVADADVCDRAGAGALLKRMLFIGHKVVLQAEMLLHCVADCVQTSVTRCHDHACLAAAGCRYLCNDTIMLLEVYFLDLVRLGDVLEGILENLEDFFRLQFLVQLVGYAFCRIAHRLAHLLRKLQSIVLLQNIADAALSGLAVDPDDIRIVGATDIGRVDRQVSHLCSSRYFIPFAIAS